MCGKGVERRLAQSVSYGEFAQRGANYDPYAWLYRGLETVSWWPNKNETAEALSRVRAGLFGRPTSLNSPLAFKTW